MEHQSFDVNYQIARILITDFPIGPVAIWWSRAMGLWGGKLACFAGPPPRHDSYPISEGPVGKVILGNHLGIRLGSCFRPLWK